MTPILKTSLYLIGSASLLTACGEPAPDPKLARTLELVDEWTIDGMYSTAEQVADEEKRNVPDEDRHNLMYQVFAKVEIDGIDGVTYFQQGSSDGTIDTTFRAGILQFFPDPETGVVRQRELNFKDVPAFVDAYKDPNKIASITMEDVTYDEGCDFHILVDDEETEIAGPMMDGTCRLPPEMFGQELIAEDEIVIMPGQYWFLGTYVNEKGEVMWGNATGILNKLTFEKPLEEI